MLNYKERAREGILGEGKVPRHWLSWNISPDVY